MSFYFWAVVLIVTAPAVLAVFDDQRHWLRVVAIWSLLAGAISLLAIAFLFGFRLLASLYERAGGTWSNEIGAVVPFARELLDPLYVVMAIWVLLLGILALRR